MNQNLYGMSTILCRDNLELNKKIKKKLDKELGLIDLTKKLVLEQPVQKEERKSAFDKAFAELSSSIELDIEGMSPVPPPVAPLVTPPVAPRVTPPVAPRVTPAPPPVAPTPAPAPATAFAAAAVSSLFGGDGEDEGMEPLGMEPLEDSLEESLDEESLDEDDEESPDEDSEKSLDEDEESPEDEDEEESPEESPEEEDSDSDDELENDFYSLDHITPKNFYSDLGASAEVSAKTNYLTKVGDIRRLSKELGISNYDVYLDKYGGEFQKGKKTIRPWDHKKYLDIVECIERLLINEKESRNMDNIMRSVICTGLEVVEKLTKGSVKIPLLDKTFHTAGLSTIYKDVSTWNKMDHRDMTNKVTGGYRPSGAASLGIKFVLETLSRQPISEDE